MKLRVTTIYVLLLLLLSSSDAAVPSEYAKQSVEWFQSAEGRRIADNVLTWQTPHGDWPKNKDTASEPFDGKSEDLRGTFDNSATTGELRFLARAFRATNEPRYEQAFLKGLSHILEAAIPEWRVATILSAKQPLSSSHHIQRQCYGPHSRTSPRCR